MILSCYTFITILVNSLSYYISSARIAQRVSSITSTFAELKQDLLTVTFLPTKEKSRSNCDELADKENILRAFAAVIRYTFSADTGLLLLSTGQPRSDVFACDHACSSVVTEIQQVEVEAQQSKHGQVNVLS